MKKSKTILQILLFGLVVFTLVAPIAVDAQAQDAAPEIQDVEGLRLQIARHTQDPFTKEVKLEVVVYSQITSDRVQVVWTVNGASKLITPSGGSSSLSVVPNHYYVSSAVIKPSDTGNTRVIAKVQAFKADGTYTSTVSLNINSLNGSLYPTTTQYTIAQIILMVRGVAAVGLVVILVSLLGYFVFTKFKKWLDREN